MTREPHDNSVGDGRSRRILAFFAILLVLGGQILLIPTTNEVMIPIMLLLTGGGILLIILAQSNWLSRFNRAASIQQPWIIPAGWFGAALILSLLAAVATYLFEKNNYNNYMPVLTLWAGSAGCYLMAFAPTIHVPADWKQWGKDHWKELAGIGAMSLLAIVLRFYHLGGVPRVVNGDEGWLGITAQSTIQGAYTNPFALWENFGALYLQFINVIIQGLGVSPFSLRLLPAIGGVLAVPAVYLLGRQIANHRIGLIAGTLLACSHTHMHFSRTAAVGYIQGTWLIPLELYFLLSGLEKKHPWRAAVGGMLLGFQFSIYLTAQIVAALVFVYMVIALILYRSQIKEMAKVWGAFWGGLIVVFIPLGANFWRHPNELFARMSMDGTFQSGWLANTMADTGHSAVQILGERVLHAFLSLIYYPAFDFYGSNIPMLTLFTATFFLLGIGLTLWKTSKPGHLLLNGYLWAPTLAVGIFSIPPSADSYRMLIVLPAALIMAALAVDELLALLGLGWNRWKFGYALITGALLVSVLLFNIWVYFFDFAGRCRYGSDNPQTRFDSYLGNYLRNTPREANVYLLSDDTFSYGGNPTVDFLSNQRPLSNFPDPVDALEPLAGTIVIANPNRIDELAAWARAHPGGELHLEFDCKNQIMLIYQIP